MRGFQASIESTLWLVSLLKENHLLLEQQFGLWPQLEPEACIGEVLPKISILSGFTYTIISCSLSLYLITLTFFFFPSFFFPFFHSIWPWTLNMKRLLLFLSIWVKKETAGAYLLLLLVQLGRFFCLVLLQTAIHNAAETHMISTKLSHEPAHTCKLEVMRAANFRACHIRCLAGWFTENKNVPLKDGRSATVTTWQPLKRLLSSKPTNT